MYRHNVAKEAHNLAIFTDSFRSITTTPCIYSTYYSLYHFCSKHRVILLERGTPKVRSKPHLVIRVRPVWLVLVPWEVVEQTLIKLSKLRTLKLAEDRRQEGLQERSRVVDTLQRTLKEVGNGLFCKNESEACKVVTFEQVLCVQHTTGKVLNTDPSEGVDLSCVSANSQGIGICEVSDTNIGGDISQAVGRDGRALVPILRDALLSFMPDEGTRLAGDTEELFEVVAVLDVVRGVLPRKCAQRVTYQVSGWLLL